MTTAPNQDALLATPHPAVARILNRASRPGSSRDMWPWGSLDRSTRSTYNQKTHHTNAHQNIHRHKNTQQRNAACVISKHLPKDQKTPVQSTSKQQDNSKPTQRPQNTLTHRPSTPKTPRRSGTLSPRGRTGPHPCLLGGASSSRESWQGGTRTLASRQPATATHASRAPGWFRVAGVVDHHFFLQREIVGQVGSWRRCRCLWRWRGRWISALSRTQCPQAVLQGLPQRLVYGGFGLDPIP